MFLRKLSSKSINTIQLNFLKINIKCINYIKIFKKQKNIHKTCKIQQTNIAALICCAVCKKPEPVILHKLRLLYLSEI